MYLKHGPTFKIVLKKAGVSKDATRSLKPNDSALRERRGRQIFCLSNTPDRVYCFLMRWGNSLVQCHQMGLNFSVVTSWRVVGLCWHEGLNGGCERWLLDRAGNFTHSCLGQVSGEEGEKKKSNSWSAIRTSNGPASVVPRAQLIIARAVIQISLFPGTSSHTCPPSQPQKLRG